MRGLAGALWLAKKELRGAWLSYSLTGLFVLFLGFFAVAGLSGVFELEGFGAWGEGVEEYYNAVFLDYLFLVVCALLGANTLSGDRAPRMLSWAPWRDSFSSRRMLFLRSSPVSAGSLVRGFRSTILFALLLNAVAYFLPAFLISDLGELGTSYLWFVGIWIGYGLFASGLCLLCELTVRGDKPQTLFYFCLAALLLIGVILIEWALGPSLVEMTAQLAQSHGALFATLCILAGGTALALISQLTTRRIEKRDFIEDLSS